MPRRLAPDRRTHVITDVVRRLDRIFLAVGRELPTGSDIIAASLRRLMTTTSPNDSGSTAQLLIAADTLRAARDAASGPDALAAWVVRFCDPMSKEAIRGLIRLWRRAVDQLRDTERHQRLKAPDSPIVTARLGRKHLRMLADIRLAHPDLSPAYLMGQGIERQYAALRHRSPKPIKDSPDLFDAPER